MTAPGPLTTTYGYDLENRLTGVANPSYTATYTYAADGLRLRVQESNAQYADRYLLYDGVRPTAEGTLSGDVFTTTARYEWEGDSYYSALVSASIGGLNRFFLYDGLGSTRQLLDDNQAVTDTYVYEAFGNSMGSTGSTPNPYRYVGSLGYYQTGNSLMHLGARYYLPEVGRFVQRDAVRIGPPYAYALNTPTKYGDPNGLLCIFIGMWHHTERHVTWQDPGDWNLTIQQYVANQYRCEFWRMMYEEGYYEKWWTKCYLCTCPSLHTVCFDSPHMSTDFAEERRQREFRHVGVQSMETVISACMYSIIVKPLPK
jgi:RHS repeat-associated protein